MNVKQLVIFKELRLLTRLVRRRSFRDRYLPTLLVATGLGLVLSAAWVYLVLRYSRHRLSLSTQLREALLAWAHRTGDPFAENVKA